MLIQTMPVGECIKVLAASHVARLACVKAERAYIVTTNFAYADNHLYAFSMPGKKLDWMRANPFVAIEVHECGHGREWKSVLVDGRYEELDASPDHQREQERAWSLLSKRTNWWEPGGLKPEQLAVTDHSPHVFYRIFIEHMSGRKAIEQERA